MLQVRITDHALASICQHIGGCAPEQGGALLGLPGIDVITDFIHDSEAPTSGVSYKNSEWLLAEVLHRESCSYARFKGVVHSHPVDVTCPSTQDESEYQTTLGLNPQVGRYLAPIVTHGVDTPPRSHELIVARTRISFYGCTLSGHGPLIEPMVPRVIPIGRSLARIGVASSAVTIVDVDSIPMFGVVANAAGIGDVTLLFSADFPAVAPILYTENGQLTVALPWSLNIPEEERLAHALTVENLDRHVASAYGDAPHSEGRLFARSHGLVSQTLAGKRVVVIGAGSVGSYLAEGLARSGVGAIDLIDADEVSAENIGRSSAFTYDIGSHKVDAVKRRIFEINRQASVRVHRHKIAKVGDDGLPTILQGADLAIAATDDNAAQLRINHVAYWLGIPAVFVGLYRNAAGGEIILSLPGKPCWRCSTAGMRDTIQNLVQPTDYGAGRLDAEPGLLADIQHLSSAALKIALGVLDDDTSSAVSRLVARPIEQGDVYVVFSMSPEYWIFPEILSGAPGQHAFHSLWMHPEGNPDCPICGDPALRSDPTDHRPPVATADQILALGHSTSARKSEPHSNDRKMRNRNGRDSAS